MPLQLFFKLVPGTVLGIRGTEGEQESLLWYICVGSGFLQL